MTGIVSESHNILRKGREERRELTYLIYNAYLTYKEGFPRSTVVYLKDHSPYFR